MQNLSTSCEIQKWFTNYSLFSQERWRENECTVMYGHFQTSSANWVTGAIEKIQETTFSS